MTIKGERPMQPNFGTDLHKLLFEPNTQELRPKLEHTIKDAVKNWLPYIAISMIEITSKIDLYQVFIKITYQVNPSQQENVVEIGANLATGGLSPAY